MEKEKTHGVVGDRRSGVEDTVATVKSSFDGFNIQEINSMQSESLLRSFQLSQMSILRII